MLKPISGLPDDVIGFEAAGKVEADDYRSVLDPAVSAAAAHGKVRMLYVLGDDFESFSPGAMWQDGKVGLSERKVWQRIAVVSDHNRILEAIHAFAWMVSGEVHTYTLAQIDEAKAWLGEASS